MDIEGCNGVTKQGSYTPKPLPEGTIKDKVTFLLKQPYQRSIKDVVKIIYPSIDERSPDFKSKYAYVRKLVTELRGSLVCFHRCGRFRLVWQGRPVALRWLIGYKREILLGNKAEVPEWMSVKSFFNVLDVDCRGNGKKYVGGSDCPCTFEISRHGYVTVFVHDRRGVWEEWLEERLVECGWPQGLVLHVFDALEPVHVDEHMTVDGFSWPRELKGSVISTPYGWNLKLGDGSHPDALEMEFKSNNGSEIKRIGKKLDLLLRVAGWVDKNAS